MGRRIGVGGYQNTGKSWGRRYIPDGENVMIIQPSVKTSHLFQSIPGIDKMTPEQIDKAITDGKRKPVQSFDIKSPEGRYNNLQEALALVTDPVKRSLYYMLAMINEKKKIDYFGKTPEAARKHLQGNIILCEEIAQLEFFIDFVNKWMPWIHTIILPDFTHFITEKLTSPGFLARKVGGEQYAKYLDLAAESLRGFIKSSDRLRKELIVVTEYHVELIPETSVYEIFTPGGKMLKEKFLPSSYYDTFLFTDVKYGENDEDDVDYRFVTRKTRKYPEARSIGNFEDLYMPNNLQDVLTKVRQYDDIALK